MTLKWTKKPPASDGWYFFRRGPGCVSWKVAKVQTFPGSVYGRLVTYDGDSYTMDDTRHAYPRCQWAGPIPEGLVPS